MWLCLVGDFSPQESRRTEAGTELAESQRGGSRGAEPRCPKVRGAMGIQLLSAVLAFYILEKAAGEQR